MAKYTDDEDDLLDDDKAPEESSEENKVSGDNDEKNASSDADLTSFLKDRYGSEGGSDNIPESSESANEPEQQQPDVPPAQMASSVPQAPQPPVPEDKMAIMKQFLQDKMGKANENYAKASDMSGVRAAQEESRRKSNIAMWGEALEGLAKSRSMARGGAGVDAGFYNAIANSGSRGVNDALALRQASVQDFLQKQAIDDRIVQQMRMQGTMEQQQQAAAYIKARRTPGSPESLAAIETLKQINPALANNPNMTAEDVEKLMKPAVSLTNQTARDKAHKENLALQNKIREDNAKDKKQARADVVAEKTDKAKDKAYKDLVDSAEGRGRAPKNISQALTTKTAIKNAQELINEYPDPNAMPQIKVNLLAAELEKVATGGAGTEGGRQGLDPGTFKENFNHFMSKAQGAPRGAELGAFIKDNAEYLNGLDKVTSGVVNNYRKNLLTGSKRLINPDHIAEYQQSYPEAFAENKEEPSPAKKMNPSDVSGMAIGAPAPKVDQKIADYAQKHNLDYDTASNILKNRGYESK